MNKMYGGTKTEMERLLVDAEKVSGIHYDINNFGDVINAIHTVQGELGITGTTAKEASSTIEGSLNMTKSAWANLLTGMADSNSDFDGLINNLVTSVGAFGENILPRIEIALNGVGKLIEQLLPPIAAKIPTLLMTLLPMLVTAGINIVTALLTGIQTNLPAIATGAVQIVTSLLTAFFTMLPQLLTIGMQLIAQLVIGIGQALPTLIPMAVECITNLVQGLVDNLPLILDAGLQLLTGLTTGIINALPQLIEALPQIIQSIVDFVATGLPQILESGLTILLALIDGLVQCLPQLIAMLPQIIESIVKFLTDNLPTIIDTGIKVLLALIDGLVNALPQLTGMIPQITSTIINTLVAHLPEIITAGIQILIALIAGLIQAIPQLISAMPQIIMAIQNPFKDVNWGDIGTNILKGIAEGLISGLDYALECAKNTCSSIKNAFTDFFDIHSPSRLMRDAVGKNIALGIAKGIELETKSVVSSVERLSVAAYNEGIANAESYTQLGTIYIDNLKSGVENRKTLLIDAFKKTVDDGVATFVGKNKEAETKYKAAGDDLVKAYTKSIEDGTNEALKNISDNIKDITNEFQKSYDDLISQREDLQNKLSGFGDMFEVDEDGDVHLNNIKKQTQAITDYSDLLNNLKNKGVSADFLSQITSLDVDKGTKVIEELLNLNDKEFSAYTSAWETKQQTAKTLAEGFYADQLTTLDTNFNSKIDAAMANVPVTMQTIGQQAMNGFMNGMDSQMEGLIKKSGNIAQSVLDTFTKAFDIHSPSRIFRDLIGKNVVKGMEVGITTESPSLLSSASDLCRQLQASMDFNTAKTTANITGSANRAANISSSSSTTTNDNGINLNIENFNGTDESNVVQLAQEIAFLGKRKVRE